MEYNYFCNYCGAKFCSTLPERNDAGILNDIFCPACGALDIYTNSPEGTAQSVKDLSDYENIAEIETELTK